MKIRSVVMMALLLTAVSAMAQDSGYEYGGPGIIGIDPLKPDGEVTHAYNWDEWLRQTRAALVNSVLVNCDSNGTLRAFVIVEAMYASNSIPSLAYESNSIPGFAYSNNPSNAIPATSIANYSIPGTKLASNSVPLSALQLGRFTSIGKQSNQQVAASTSLITDRDLTAPISTNTVAVVKVLAPVTFGGGDISFRIDVPSGGVFHGVYSFHKDGASDQIQAVVDATTTFDLSVGTTTNAYIVISGVVSNATSLGNVALKWAQRVSNVANTSVNAGGILELSAQQ